VDLARFTAIPPLEREQVQDRDPSLVSTTADTRFATWYASGGSTGAPAQILVDRDTSAWFLAVQNLHDSWAGYRPGERRALVWGSERDLYAEREKLRTVAGRWLRNETVLNAFRMDFDRMRRYLGILHARRPALIVGYADCLVELARLAEREAIPVWSPHAIISTAGTLYPEMRAAIERVFRAPVFDRYGSREVGDVACEDSSHNGLVVCAPTHYVEIAGPEGDPCRPGETGEMLITLLVNYSMPLIRYRVGDLAAWAEEADAAGRTWPVLRHIAGRTMDVFQRADGGVVSPSVFVYTVGIALNDGWVHKYQVIQEALDEFRILIVPGDGDLRPSSRETQLAGIRGKMKHAVGPDCRVHIELVPSIEPSPSGKHRWLVCKAAAAPASAPRLQ
jgi:phenylacetate-CoA ligase